MSYPPPSGQPAYGGPPVPPDHPKAQSALIFGILGLVCCGPLGIVGFIQGNNALREIEASGGAFGGAGMAKAGKICGLIAMILTAIGLVVFLFLIAASLVMAPAGVETTYP